MKQPNFLRRLTSLAGVLCLSTVAALAADSPPKVLVVTITTEFRHSSISTAEKVLARLAKESGAFTIDLVQQPPNEPRGPRPAKKDDAADAARFQEENATYRKARSEWMGEVTNALKRLSRENLKN